MGEELLKDQWREGCTCVGLEFNYQQSFHRIVKDVTNVSTAGRLTWAAIVSRKVEEQTDFHYSYSDLGCLLCTTQMIPQSIPQLHYTKHREMKFVCSSFLRTKNYLSRTSNNAKKCFKMKYWSVWSTSEQFYKTLRGKKQLIVYKILSVQ